MTSALLLTSAGRQVGIVANVSTSFHGASMEMASMIGSVTGFLPITLPLLAAMPPSFRGDEPTPPRAAGHQWGNAWQALHWSAVASVFHCEVHLTASVWGVCAMLDKDLHDRIDVSFAWDLVERFSTQPREKPADANRGAELIADRLN